MTIVSGLALGIDGAAHEATVLAGGCTVAVLGSGHDRLFPAAHGRLAARIVESGGALVSELPPEAIPTRGTFPRRNRVISGMAEATVVVEAAARSIAVRAIMRALCQVTAVQQGIPERIETIDAARETAGRADDGDRRAQNGRTGARLFFRQAISVHGLAHRFSGHRPH